MSLWRDIPRTLRACVAASGGLAIAVSVGVAVWKNAVCGIETMIAGGFSVALLCVFVVWTSRALSSARALVEKLAIERADNPCTNAVSTAQDADDMKSTDATDAATEPAQDADSADADGDATGTESTDVPDAVSEPARPADSPDADGTETENDAWKDEKDEKLAAVDPQKAAIVSAFVSRILTLSLVKFLIVAAFLFAVLAVARFDPLSTIIGISVLYIPLLVVPFFVKSDPDLGIAPAAGTDATEVHP